MLKIEAITIPCPKCAGKGRLAHYQHVKAGECFQCGGTGKSSTAAEVEMTPAEILAMFTKKTGLEVVQIPTVESEDDWIGSLFSGAESLKSAALVAEQFLITL